MHECYFYRDYSVDCNKHATSTYFEYSETLAMIRKEIDSFGSITNENYVIRLSCREFQYIPGDIKKV